MRYLPWCVVVDCQFHSGPSQDRQEDVRPQALGFEGREDLVRSRFDGFRIAIRDRKFALHHPGLRTYSDHDRVGFARWLSAFSRDQRFTLTKAQCRLRYF